LGTEKSEALAQINNGTKNGRFDHHIKKHLVCIHKNLYLNPGDPQYYEKILRYLDPHSDEAHYMVAKKYEQAGSMSKALFHYQEAAQSLSSPYYVKAKEAIRRIGKTNSASKSANESPSLGAQPKRRKLSTIAKSIIVCLLLFNFALLLLLLNIETTRAVVSSVKSWMVGMEVVYETIDAPYVIYLPPDKPAEEIEKTLYSKAVDMGKNNPRENIQLYGIKTTDPTLVGKIVPLPSDKMKEAAFVKAEYNAAIDRSVKIQFQNNEFKKHTSSVYPLTFAATNLVRTALQAYIEDKGSPPSSIEHLVADYPNNYVSFIPNEAQSGSNRVTAQFDGKGGWVYQPHANQLSDMFYPNISGDRQELHIPYEPVHIVISKNDYTLKVTSGGYVLASKPVGLGKNGQTPIGSFTVEDRVLNPLGKHPKVYGRAGLGMSKYAIHGTYQENSIGANHSLGCVRLTNKDMLEIFPLAPKGSSVRIASDLPAVYQHAPVMDSTRLFPAKKPQTNQTPKNMIFNWLG